jgi:hypothetical protein
MTGNAFPQKRISKRVSGDLFPFLPTLETYHEFIYRPVVELECRVNVEFIINLNGGLIVYLDVWLSIDHIGLSVDHGGLIVDYGGLIVDPGGLFVD